MITGDASVNRDAPIICCTAEILANMALREGKRRARRLRRRRRVPLLRGQGARRRLADSRSSCSSDAQFLLMSATLGPTETFEKALHEADAAGPR